MEVDWPRMNAIIDMKPIDCSTTKAYFHIDESQLEPDVECMSKILDTKYAPCDIWAYVDGQKHLSQEEQQQLYDLLSNYADLFNGTLGEWQCKPYHIPLKDGIQPYHG